MSSQSKASDNAAAAAIAAEMKQQAGQQGAVRVAASKFADQLESHHYPSSPGDGVIPGALVGKAIAGSLLAYQKVVPDYRMDERISLRGNIVTVTSFTTGTFVDGDLFDDVSVVAYQVRQDKIVRADAIHTNPGSIQKAMRGSGDQAAADHLAAEKIAAEMRAANGSPLEIAAAHLAERVATWSADDPEHSALHERQAMIDEIKAEVGKTRGAKPGGADRVQVLGNKIVVDSGLPVRTPGPRPVWSSPEVILHVTANAVVGVEAGRQSVSWI